MFLGRFLQEIVMVSRRLMFAGAASVGVLAALRFTQNDVSAKTFEIVKSDEEWKRQLSPLSLIHI